jgi:hypothetical protein
VIYAPSVVGGIVEAAAANLERDRGFEWRNEGHIRTQI